MRKIMVYLNGVKSVCLMLLACLTLSVAATSCNQDEFENYEPEKKREFTKAELIDQALSKLPKTRANGDMPVVMVTEKTEVSILGLFTGSMKIDWGDGGADSFENYCEVTHSYADGEPCHVIFFKDSLSSAVEELWIEQNGLIYLDITNNAKLTTLDCSGNELEMLDFSGCKALEVVIASYNNLKSVDMSPLKQLRELHLDNNQLEYLDISNHPLLSMADLGHNSITELNLSNNPELSNLSLEHLPIEKLNHLSVHDSSFIGFPEFPQLNGLDISYTPFTSLDISMNPNLLYINVSNSKINRLNISNGAIGFVNANGSELTNLIYTPDKILNLYDLRISNTPFERSSSNLYPLLTSGLPDRKKPDKYNRILKGHLYTTMLSLVAPFSTYLANKDWIVNQ